MTPSIQSQDHTFNVGSSSATQEGPQSAMLFTAPKSRPSRVYKPVGPGFGRDTLRPPSSLSDTAGMCQFVCVCVHACIHTCVCVCVCVCLALCVCFCVTFYCFS